MDGNLFKQISEACVDPKELIALTGNTDPLAVKEDSQNKDWGFWGTIEEYVLGDMNIVWNAAVDALKAKAGLDEEQAESVLDSQWGRHFADQLIDKGEKRQGAEHGENQGTVYRDEAQKWIPRIQELANTPNIFAKAKKYVWVRGEQIESVNSIFSNVKKLNESFGDAERDYPVNGLPDEKSNWRGFAEKFDIGILDLDDFASRMGFKNFRDLDISISPKALYQRDPQKFKDALLLSSGRAKNLGPEKISAEIETLGEAVNEYSPEYFKVGDKIVDAEGGDYVITKLLPGSDGDYVEAVDRWGDDKIPQRFNVKDIKKESMAESKIKEDAMAEHDQAVQVVLGTINTLRQQLDALRGRGAEVEREAVYGPVFRALEALEKSFRRYH